MKSFITNYETVLNTLNFSGGIIVSCTSPERSREREPAPAIVNESSCKEIVSLTVRQASALSNL